VVYADMIDALDRGTADIVAQGPDGVLLLGPDATAMRTVGLLMVSALMVIPVAAAQNIFRGFRASLTGAMVIGLVASVGGYLASIWADLASGAMIVLITIGCFVASWPVAALAHRSWHPRRDPDPQPLPHQTTTEHAHVHGPGCGHQVVEHGDHLDYIHSGHLHARHQDHYDEH
jgi:zinc transport system permease protein